jgi:hypothetical protein
MTVDDLIDALRKYPGDTEVSIDADTDDFHQLLSIDDIGSESYYETVSHRVKRVVLHAK